jgi:hypothetical protein
MVRKQSSVEYNNRKENILKDDAVNSQLYNEKKDIIKDNNDSLEVLKSMKTEDKEKAFKPIRKIRIDLVIFGILIYILGMFTGLFVGVGISQGDLSLTSFQRFFSSENQIQIEDIGDNETGINANHGIIINNVAGGKSDGAVIGDGSGEGSGGGSAGGSSVTYMGDAPVDTEHQDSITGEDSANYPVVDTTPVAD